MSCGGAPAEHGTMFSEVGLACAGCWTTSAELFTTLANQGRLPWIQRACKGGLHGVAVRRRGHQRLACVEETQRMLQFESAHQGVEVV